MTIQKQDTTRNFLRFSEYIKLLPTQWVFDHFLKKTSSTRQILSSSATNERIRQFSQPDALVAAYTSLESELQVTCAMTYLMGGMGLVTDGVADLNDPLIISFFVFASRNRQGEVRYFGFSEFETALRPLFAARLARAAAAKGKVQPIPERHGNCTNDITMIVTLASQGVLEKKKQGGLTRNSLQRIGRLTHEASLLQEQDNLAEMLVKYCVHAGIVQENETGYYPVTDLFEGWLLRGAKERIEDILDFAIGFCGSWRTDILRGTVVCAKEGWLSCTCFPDEVRKVAIDTLRILCWAGVVSLSRAGTDTVFGMPRGRSTVSENPAASSNPTCKIVLMPDFAAVIPPELSPECLYRFGKIGVVHSLDRVYKGTIKREILNDSLSNGLEGADVLAWLAEWDAPANVIATVREWEREFYRVYLTSGPLLVTTEERVSLQIASFAPLKQYLEPMPAHSVFRIKNGMEEKVRDFLGRMGFDYRMPDRDRARLRESAGTAATDGAGLALALATDEVISQEWEPVVTIGVTTDNTPLALRGKKYGAGLKTLDLNEIMHIIDYAILTGTELVLDYAGSPLIKKGEYTVLPGSCTKGADPQLDATLKTGLKKRFNVRKISKIGVGIS